MKSTNATFLGARLTSSATQAHIAKKLGASVGIVSTYTFGNNLWLPSAKTA